MISDIYLNSIQFLAAHPNDIKFKKLMVIKKNGSAISRNGDINLSRDYYDTELICVSNETGDYWIGNYAEGIGFFDVHFAKEDCRAATDEEVVKWIKNPELIKFWGYKIRFLSDKKGLKSYEKTD